MREHPLQRTVPHMDEISAEELAQFEQLTAQFEHSTTPRQKANRLMNRWRVLTATHPLRIGIIALVLGTVVMLATLGDMFLVAVAAVACMFAGLHIIVTNRRTVLGRFTNLAQRAKR